MAIDSSAFKDLMASVAQTVTVVTVETEEGPAGLTVSAFNSVSADPPIVLVCIDVKAATLPTFLSTSGFTVNLLPEGSGDLAMLFATHGADRFGRTEWRSVDGAGPILDAAFQHMVCRIVERVEMGDHWVIFGEVVDSGRSDDSANPLVFLKRGFARAHRT